MAKSDNAGTIIALLAGVFLLYMLAKNGLFSSKAAGAQTAGTPKVGAPTNPFAGVLSPAGLQLANQFGISTAPADVGESDVGLINNISIAPFQPSANNPFNSGPSDSSGEVFTAPNGGVAGGLGITGYD